MGIDGMYRQNKGYMNSMEKQYGTMEEGAKADLTVLIGRLSSNSYYVRNMGAVGLALSADMGTDITPALPALVAAISTPQKDVCEGAVGALLAASANEKSRDAGLEALNHALSHEDAGIRRNATFSLERVAWNGADISNAIPAVLETLCDNDVYLQAAAARILERAARNGVKIDFSKVTESLDRCVNKAMEAGDDAVIGMKKELCAGFYTSIANAIGKSKQGISMGGELLDCKITPPRGANGAEKADVGRPARLR